MTDPVSLPSDRVKDAAVFEVVGADLAGSLYIKRGNKETGEDRRKKKRTSKRREKSSEKRRADRLRKRRGESQSFAR
ncbi:hypothetical protein TNCV_2294811 [Trichonephila clavipes]|nr:hypothetical protein TNCV_2294811 [Trichonephila clavipes]